MANLGSLFMGLALVAALLSIGAIFLGRRMGPKEGEGLTNTGYLATYGILIGITGAISVLTAAFLQEDFTLEYVAQHHSTDVSALQWVYKVAAVWAGREGSLLFWAWLLAIFAAYIAYKRSSFTDDLSNVSLAVLNFVQIFFITALFIPLNNPFKLSPEHWVGPGGELLISGGMNPLLQHWAMTLHPPTLFVGYAGMAVPFAFAFGALIVNDPSKAWVEIVDRITVFAWLFLGLGNGLGAVWAYVVLGWGGYWAWDPVENASFIPWLTGVALLHSFTVYRRRGGFKKWAVALAVISFVGVILGTFIVRSGIVQSVHAFTQDELSFWWFLAMMVGSLAAVGVGLLYRGDSFKGADEFDSLTSKESSYYFNNVLMLVAAVVIAALTLSPALGGKTYGPATYDAIARPVGILYCFIMAVCPLLAWRKTDPNVFFEKIKWPLVSTAVISAALIYLWWTVMWPHYLFTKPYADPLTSLAAWEAIIGLIVGALAVSVAVWLFIEGGRRRAAAKGESFGAALWAIVTKARTQSGGYLAHLGVGIILIGLVGSSMFVKDMKISIPDEPGASFEVGGYDFVYQGVATETLANEDTRTQLTFAVSRDGESRGVATPGQRRYAQQEQTRFHVSVIVEPLRDIFVVYEGFDEAGNIQLNVKINPLISWVWFGFGLLSVGTVLAMWPKRRLEAA
ncbi:MAG: heme lyase CcmF/NrfE family subunit [Clostridiales bacterium]|nr:heme lyase CcmF/NrfE family subunit [Clostridiales bacterium]